MARPPFLRRVRPIPLIPIGLTIWAICLATGHQAHFGFLLLISLFFLIRFLIWPYGRWAMWRAPEDREEMM